MVHMGWCSSGGDYFTHGCNKDHLVQVVDLQAFCRIVMLLYVTVLCQNVPFCVDLGQSYLCHVLLLLLHYHVYMHLC